VLLREANADATGDMWNSLAGVLPPLAEAAPDAFLDGVRHAAAGPSPVIAAMFTDSGPVRQPASSPATIRCCGRWSALPGPRITSAGLPRSSHGGGGDTVAGI